MKTTNLYIHLNSIPMFDERQGEVWFDDNYLIQWYRSEKMYR